MSAPACAYKDHTTIRCEGRYALFTAHDQRGCRHVRAWRPYVLTGGEVR